MSWAIGIGCDDVRASGHVEAILRVVASRPYVLVHWGRLQRCTRYMLVETILRVIASRKWCLGILG